MRFYVSATEAFEEIKRDISEMGILVKPKSMQDKNIEGNEDYFTKELQDYSYRILDCDPKKVPRVTQPWADAEFEERVDQSFIPDSLDIRNGPIEEYHKNMEYINPGRAYLLRDSIWSEFLHEGQFAYSYNERINWKDQLWGIIKRLRNDPDSRQTWLSLWDPNKDPQNMGGMSRVPCSLGYNFQVREGKINIHYIMRSCDYATHFPNDVYLAMKLLNYVADKTGYTPGMFTHTIFSLHVYNKDIQGVF